MKNMRLVSLAAVVLTSVLVLAGCSSSAGSDQSSQTGSQEPASGKFPAGTSINYWMWLDVPTSRTIYKLAAEFKKQTNITVNIQSDVASSQFYDHLVNAIAAGDGPDVTMTNTPNYAQLATSNALAPLNSYISKWKQASAIDKSYWDELKDPANGNTYAVPMMANVQLLYYRADLLKAAGVAVPKTQAQMVAAAKALYDPSKGQYGYDARGSSGTASADPWAAWLLSAGAQFTDSKGKIALDSPAARAANKTYLSLYKYADPGALNDGTAQVMANMESGAVGMMVSNLGKWATLKPLLGDKIGITYVPSLTGNIADTNQLAGLNVNAILANSQKKAADFAWISFLSEKKAQLTYMSSPNGYLSVIPSVNSEPPLSSDLAVQVSEDALKKAKAIVWWPNVSGSSIVENEVWSPLYQGALLGKNSANALLDGVVYTLKHNTVPGQ